MLIIISVIVSILILHIISWFISVTFVSVGFKINKVISNSKFNQKKGLKRGKSSKIYTIKRGGIFSYLIFIIFISILLIATTLFIFSVLEKKVYFQFWGFLFLVIDLIFIVWVDNLLITQSLIKVDHSINKETSYKSENIVKSYFNQRIKFFIENTMFSFFMVTSIFLVAFTLTIDIFSFFIPTFILGSVIGSVILLSLYSNMFIVETWIFNKEENPFKNNLSSEIYVTQKKLIIYLIVFLLGTYVWYEDFIKLESNFDPQNFRVDLLLVATILLFFLSTDRIFKIINDDYIKFKKDVR
ncbi:MULTISPECIES: hypothetical protein [unclassified Exiguobacterium]|uniref:hypothetical protein n=1 Tax=unclassified Exiguobacterium TaxID=2644629 RepID=UPI0025BB7783|nr:MULTISPECIES: hypothetical protein [unclassified Exiguobacterium]